MYPVAASWGAALAVHTYLGRRARGDNGLRFEKCDYHVETVNNLSRVWCFSARVVRVSAGTMTEHARSKTQQCGRVSGRAAWMGSSVTEATVDRLITGGEPTKLQPELHICRNGPWRRTMARGECTNLRNLRARDGIARRDH